MSLSIPQAASVLRVLWLDAPAAFAPEDGAHILGLYRYDFTSAVPPEPEPGQQIVVSDYIDDRRNRTQSVYQSVGDTIEAAATPVPELIQKREVAPAPTLPSKVKVEAPLPPEPQTTAPPEPPQVDVDALMQAAAARRQAEEMARQQRIASALQNWQPPQVSPEQHQAAINLAIRNMLPAKYRG